MRFLPTVAIAAVLATALAAAPPARAAEPAIGDCLLAAEASLKLRSEHKLKLTRTQLLVCSSASCPVEVRQECMKRIDEVNAASPTIVLAVKNGAGEELSAVKVSVDGQLLTDHLDGSALSVDPGAHEFTFEAAGAPPLTQTIILHEGDKNRRETVQLGGPPSAEAGEHAPEPGAHGAGASASAAEGAGSGQRTLGLVAGGVGVAGLIVGGIFGAIASSAWNSAQQACPTHNGCTPTAMNDRSGALTDATVSTAGFIAGGVLLAAGAVVFFTAPKGEAPQVGVEARPGGLAITGRF